MVLRREKRPPRQACRAVGGSPSVFRGESHGYIWQGDPRLRSIAWTSLLAVACATLSLTASAQATGGRASSIVFPVVAHTSSFETQVFVRNPNTFSIDVDVLYYETIDPLNPPAPPGLVGCTMLTLAPNSVVSFKLGTQCPPIAAGSHYGLLVLRDHATEKIHSFGAFSRVQHVGTNQGFSIEGFPEHTFSGRVSGVNGLKRVAAAAPPTTAQPGYIPNCFVGSLVRLSRLRWTSRMAPTERCSARFHRLRLPSHSIRTN